VWSLIYPARKAHAPYYFVICGLSGCISFSTLSHKRHDFRETLLNIKCVFWFSLKPLFETFLILRLQRDIIINIHKSHVNYALFLSLELSHQIFEKSNIKFHKNPSNGSRVVPCGWTDRQTEMTKLIVEFRNFANAPNKTRSIFLRCWTSISIKKRNLLELLRCRPKKTIFNFKYIFIFLQFYEIINVSDQSRCNPSIFHWGWGCLP
jgi:hypothetical protein